MPDREEVVSCDAAANVADQLLEFVVRRPMRTINTFADASKIFLSVDVRFFFDDSTTHFLHQVFWGAPRLITDSYEYETVL